MLMHITYHEASVGRRTSRGSNSSARYYEKVDIYEDGELLPRPDSP